MKKRILTNLLLPLLALLISRQRLEANIYTVTNTANSGGGSLRQAIADANSNPGADTIRFNILPVGNTFETIGVNSFAVIQLNTTLPTITGALFIDGFTQPNTNLGSLAGRVVGADNILQASIPYPDVYIVPSSSYSFPGNSNGVTGNCISINTNNVHIRGLAISGFGNTNTASGTASGHAEIQVLRSATVRNTNISINNCFLSCDPRGNYPSLSRRRSKGNAVLLGGNNWGGEIFQNLIAHAGTYGIHVNGLIDNNSVGPTNTVLPTRNWRFYENQLIDLGRNVDISNASRVADGINTMRCIGLRIENNYLEDIEQVAIDLGYNADSNYVSNNTITGLTRTNIVAPHVGIRIGLNSQRDTLIKNVIHDNSGSLFRGGIWIDRSAITHTSIANRDNAFNVVQENIIYNNNASGIVLSTSGTGNCHSNTITRNSTYNNVGLGIDLNYNGTTGPTTVSVNDNGDVDAGTNNIQNFPIIDSAKFDGSYFYIWGKGPASSTMEFFIGDGGINRHGGLGLNYGEGRTFIGSAIEDGPDDGIIGVTGSYNIDGNIAVNNVNRFQFIFPFSGSVTSVDSLTSTATVAGNTSEFGPINYILDILGCNMLTFSAVRNEYTTLHWEALCDSDFRQFELERSYDGKSFTRIAVIPRAVIAPQKGNYSFIDRSATGSSAYYRLRLVSDAANTQYSNVLRIVGTQSREPKIFPNPFDQILTIEIGLETAGKVDAKLRDAGGRMICSKTYAGSKGINVFNLDVSASVQPGVYYLETIVEGVSTIKPIRKR